MTKRLVAQTAVRLLGRRNVVRLARLLSNEARFDVPNDLTVNGEQIVQRVALSRSSAEAQPVVFDVGANVGNWTRSLLTQSGVPPSLRVHAFEPFSGTFSQLTRNIADAELQEKVLLTQSAVSSIDGTAEFHSLGAGAGRNSLHSIPDAKEPAQIVSVPTVTLDTYCTTRGIDRISLLKIDTEGHDIDVIAGAMGLLRRGAIDILQFEYNWRWIAARHYLADAFDVLAPLGYEIGKVTPEAIEFYPAWHHELETFREANFIAVQPSTRTLFPEIAWWR